MDGARTGWGNRNAWGDYIDNVWPDWLQVDLNGTKTIDEIDVVTVQDNPNSKLRDESMAFMLYGPTAFDVQYWNGSPWANIPNGSITGNNQVLRKFSFSPITTSKIRVLVNNALNRALPQKSLGRIGAETCRRHVIFIVNAPPSNFFRKAMNSRRSAAMIQFNILESTVRGTFDVAEIETITDTLNRVLTFNYDTNARDQLRLRRSVRARNKAWSIRAPLWAMTGTVACNQSICPIKTQAQQRFTLIIRMTKCRRSPMREVRPRPTLTTIVISSRALITARRLELPPH